MGSRNHGEQKAIPTDFYHEIVSENYANFLTNSIPTGIYAGGWLYKISDSEIELSKLDCVISDGEHCTIIHTTQTATLSEETLDSGTVSSTTPYVVLRWAYSKNINNFMEVHCVGISEIENNDLVVGKCVFSGSTLSGFDYSLRSEPLLLKYWLRPEATGDADLYIRIRGGRCRTANGIAFIPSQKVGPFIVPTSPNGRVDLVYVDTDGTLKIQQGNPGTNPIAPNYDKKLVLAEVTLWYNSTSIPSNQILDVRSFLPITNLIPDNVTLGLSSEGLLEVKNIFGNKRYESDWFAVSPKQIYTLTHNLATFKLSVEVFFAPSLGSNPDLSKITKVDVTNCGLEANSGCTVQDITETQLKIGTYTKIGSRLVSGSRQDYSSGFYKVIAIAIN